MRNALSTRRIFSYEEAAAMIPDVLRITEQAVAAVEALEDEEPETYEQVVSDWAEAIMSMGIEVKGLWLIDFDCGSGYYCWKHPEPALEFFHGYEEGYPGRIRLT